MSLIPTNRHNPCAICDDTSGKCRQGREDPTYWQCMTYADSKKGEVVNGFKCIGQIPNGIWSAFKPDNSQDWSEQQRLEWQRENQQRQQKKAKEYCQLSIEERDESIRALAAHFGLNPRHKHDLNIRGLNDEAIEENLYFTIYPDSLIPINVSPLLPGILYEKIKAAGSGYACVTFNPHGKATGWQLRLDGTRDNKYRWAKGESSSHLSNGELPITSAYPVGELKRSFIGICEGINKATVAANRLGQIFIGAASANFAASPQQLEDALHVASSHLGGTKRVEWAADAGSVNNPHILKAYQRSWNLLKQLGYEVFVSWWGQADKSSPDIDELQDPSLIQFISIEDFLCKVTSHSQSTAESKSLNPQKDSGWLEKARKNWRKNRKFTDAIISNNEWVNWEKPPANSIFFGKAGLGRGKTTELVKQVREWKKERNGFLCLGYRNSLLLQLCEKLGFYHLHEKEAALMRKDSEAGIALCVDSLWKFSPKDFDGKIIILDEVKSVIKHLLHSPTIRNRDKILELFHEAIKRAKQVICLDGLMADWCVDYLHSICPEKQVIKAENIYQRKKSSIKFLLGTIEEENGKIKVNDRSPWLKLMREKSNVPVICSDSQVMIEALDNYYLSKGLKTLRVDSKTVQEAYVREFLADCNTYILLNRPDVLLYTPSAESGVDVSIPDYFTEHFAFFFGVIDIDAQLQMLGRIRDDITKYVWCKNFVSDEKQNSKSPFIEKILKSLNQLLINDIATSIDDSEGWSKKVVDHLSKVIQSSNDVNLRVSSLIQSINNFEKSNLRECLREALTDAGYAVEDVVGESNNSQERVKEETEDIKCQNAKDIFNAEKIAIESIKQFEGFDAKWEDRCKVMQARLRERLPGIDESPIWSEEFIYRTKYEERDFISNQEMYFLFNYPEIAKQQSQKQFHWMARKINTFIGTYKNRWSKIHALHEIGMSEFIESGEEWTDNSPELISLLKRAKNHCIALGYQGKLSNIQFFGKLLGILGIKLKSRKTGKKTRCYHIDRELLNDPVRLQVLTCLERKFLETPGENLTQTDWENAINEAHGILPENALQTLTEQVIQVETPDPVFVYISQGSGVSISDVSSEVEIEPGIEVGDTGISTQDIGDTSHHSLYISQRSGVSSKLDRMLSKLTEIESEDDLAQITFNVPERLVRDAIDIGADDQPRRNRLRGWYERLKTSNIAFQVARAWFESKECLQGFLASLGDVGQRWEAIQEFEVKFPKEMETLDFCFPDWAEWSCLSS